MKFYCVLFSSQISQLDELLAIRHCNFIVGDAGAGKSSCWKVLKETRSRMDPSNKVKVRHTRPHSASCHVLVFLAAPMLLEVLLFIRAPTRSTENTTRTGPFAQDVDINPKTMPTEELYGHISLATREWKDGLLSIIMRDLGAIANEAPKWIVLDGDLDANWIESMNSVMDDNRVSISTGENIRVCTSTLLCL